MRNHGKKIKAMTLTELLVVMSVMVILLAISVPVAKKLSQSLGESTGARSIIAAAMANARAIAIREGHYAGVRFQQDSTGRQYIVLVIHDQPGTRLANGFRAFEGKKPMALPDDVGVITGDTYTNALLATAPGITGATTFSVVFSPSGKFVIHQVQVRNKDGKTDNTSNDRVFNTQSNVLVGMGIFIQDDYPLIGLTIEDSVSSFKIYSKKEFDKLPVTLRWTGNPGKNDGLAGLDNEFVNPYTGELVKK